MSNFITDGIRVAQLQSALQSLEESLEFGPNDVDVHQAVRHTRIAIQTAEAKLKVSSRGFVVL